MNTYVWKNNLYKNGDYRPDNSKAMVVEKARNNEPSLSQVQFRDALYKFCVEKQLVRDGFRLGRTNRAISSNIQALITILKKNGLADEFFGERKDNERKAD